MNAQDQADIQAALARGGSQFAGAASIDPQAEMIQQQLARAHAMRMRTQGQAYGALAGAGQGLASLFEAIHESQLENQQKENIAARQAMIAKFLRSQQQPNPQGVPDYGTSQADPNAGYAMPGG